MARDLARAFSMWFRAVNLAEKVHRIRRRRGYFLEASEHAQPGGVEAALLVLKERGATSRRGAGAAEETHIEPVFTAHPTESARRTLLRKNQRIAGLLLDRLDPTLTPQELRQNWSPGAHRAHHRLADRGSSARAAHGGGRTRTRGVLSCRDPLPHPAGILWRARRGPGQGVRRAAGITRAAEHRAASGPGWAAIWTATRTYTPRPSARRSRANSRSSSMPTSASARISRNCCRRVRAAAPSRPNSHNVSSLYATLIPGAQGITPIRHDRMPYRVFLGQVSERLSLTYDGRPNGYEGPQHFLRDLKLIATSLGRIGASMRAGPTCSA